jgi:hypothetical protein
MDGFIFSHLIKEWPYSEFSSGESDEFRDFVQHLQSYVPAAGIPYDPPTRSEMERKVMELAEKTENGLRSYFKVLLFELSMSRAQADLGLVKDLDTTIHLSLDAWTSETRGVKRLAIFGHWLDKDWRYQEVLLDFCSPPNWPNSGVDLADITYKCIMKLNIETKVSLTR